MAVNFTTWSAPCGCRITYRWDTADDPAHRKHTPVGDAEHAAARRAHSGRDFPAHIARQGCAAHADDDPAAHMRKAFLAHYVAHPAHRLEWHADGGLTLHVEVAA